MSNLTFKHGPIFKWNKREYESGKTLIVNQGGSSSGKTWAILQFLIFTALQNDNITIDVVRKFRSTVKKSTMKDFINLMTSMGIYNPDSFNKSELIYKFDNGSEILFEGADNEQYVRGRRRDIVYFNEVNEIDKEVFYQIKIRTKKTIFCDYNPSFFEHYIEDEIRNSGAVLLKSTYKDNPFLSNKIIKDLEELISIDENYYKIYVLGEKPIAHNRIYTHFQLSDIPHDDMADEILYGLDFGYNHPTALIKVLLIDDTFYVKEEIYESGLTSEDLVDKMEMLGISKVHSIWADPARPEIIEDIRRAGFNIRGADKSVKDGINVVKSSKIKVDKESVNIMNEYSRYSWKMNGERITDEVVKVWDDALDALRYAIYSRKTKGSDLVDWITISI